MRVHLTFLSVTLMFLLIFSSTVGVSSYEENANTPIVATSLSQSSSITASNASNLKQLTFLKREQVTQLTWSPDGQILAVAGLSGVKLYDAKTLSPTPRQLANSDKGIRRLAFSSDGKLLVTATFDLQGIGGKSNTIELWDATTGTLKIRFQENRNTLYDGAASSVVFSPDNTLVASGDWGNVVHLWDVKTGLQKAILSDHMQPVWSVAFNSAGTVLASASADGTVRLWNVGAQTQIAVIKPGNDNILNVVFAPNNTLLATGDQDGTIQLWDVTTIKNPKEITSLKGPSNPIINLAFSLDATVLASANADSTILLWDVQRHKEIAVLQSNVGNVNSLAFDPSGAILASGGDEGLQLWSVSS